MRKAVGILVIAMGLALGAGCSDDGPALRFWLTDAPEPALGAVKVTITSVAVHHVASAGPDEGG